MTQEGDWPTIGNTHEVARYASPEARVAYVDHDPVVLANGRSMLHGVPNTAIINQDLLEPDEILADPALRNAQAASGRNAQDLRARPA